MRLFRRAHDSKKGGFTLIELLVVIAIMMVLMGMLFFAVGPVMDGAKRSRAAGEMAAIGTSLNDYRLDNGQLPVAEQIQTLGSVDSPTGYDGLDHAETQYIAASRVLFFALTGRRKYEFDAATPSGEKNYLVSMRDDWVGDPDAPDLSAQDLNVSARNFSLFDPQSPDAIDFTKGGSWLRDPWGNPYGYFYRITSAPTSVFSPESYDLWSTAGTREPQNASDEVAAKWLGSWKAN